jgi:hypothetical protein
MRPGSVVREAWGVYRSHWRHFIPLAFTYFLLLALATFLLTVLLGWLGALASGVFSLLGVFWLQGALVEAVADVRDGRADLSIGETFARARPFVFALLGAGVLAVLGIMAGLVLLVVPGLVLLTWWSLIGPVIVLERASVGQSFGRSRQLVRGHGWSVFGVIVLTVLALILGGLVIAVALLWVPDEIRNPVTNLVSNSLLAPFAAIAWTLMYYRLAPAKGETEQAAPAR